jgi:hypothetical protein
MQSSKFIYSEHISINSILFFFWIRKRILLKKRKVPLSTQIVYKGTSQLAHKKTLENPQRPTISNFTSITSRNIKVTLCGYCMTNSLGVLLCVK